jgi:hypothetical protein
VIPGESRQEYEDLRAELFDDLRPQGRVETILAEQMVQAQWKLQRLWMREAGVYMEFEQRRPLGNTPLPLQLRACARQDSHSRAAGELDKLTLDQARCLNQFQRTLRAFTALRDQRRKGFVNEEEQATPSTLGQPGESVDRGAEDGEAPVTASQPVGDAPAEDTANLAPSDSSDGASGEIVDREAGGGRGVASPPTDAPDHRGLRPMAANVWRGTIGNTRDTRRKTAAD